MDSQSLPTSPQLNPGLVHGEGGAYGTDVGHVSNADPNAQVGSVESHDHPGATIQPGFFPDAPPR